MSWVIDHSKHNSNAFVVLLMIANHAKSDGTGAWPSVPVLAVEARCSQKSVQRAILTLVASGELQIDKQHGPRNSRLYSIPAVKQGGHFDQSKSPVRGDIPSLEGRHPVPRNKEEPSLKQPSKPKCRFNRCNGSGIKASISKPGKQVLCECQEEDSPSQRRPPVSAGKVKYA